MSDQWKQKLKLHEHLPVSQGVFGYSPESVSVPNCEPAINKANTATSVHEIGCSGLVITGDNVVILGQAYYLSTQWFIHTVRKSEPQIPSIITWP